MDGGVVALSGELGSGKSSVAERLARALGARRVSTGEAQRHIAEQRGVTTLELNRLAESDPTIDDEIDAVFRSLASAQEPLVVDSRLAWHFLPRSFKVHLVVDPAVGARRILARPGSHAEHYDDLGHALAGIEQRVASEQRRFSAVYGIDIFRLDNYDLVVDTTLATPDEVAERVLGALRAVPTDPRPALLLAPSRVVARGPARPAPDDLIERDGLAVPDDLVEEVRRPGFGRLAPIAVRYRRPDFTLVDGGRRLEAAKRAGMGLLPAVLEGDERPTGR